MGNPIVPTNKPVLGVETPNQGKINPTLVCDWITVVGHVADQYQGLAKSWLIDLPSSVVGVKQLQSYKSRYKLLLRKAISSTAWYLIEAWPKRGATPLSWCIAKAGTYVMIDDLLDQAAAWQQAIQDFTSAASTALAAS